jgi:glycosyltransferase involved in cell wall biosynthesis
MVKISNFKKYARKGVTVLKNEGVVSLGIKGLTAIQKKKMQHTSNPAMKRQFVSLVDRESVMKADWSTNKYDLNSFKRKVKAPYTINWVMSPPSGGGGHQNIFRFISLLDKMGHKNNIYLYSTYDDMTVAQAKENVKGYSSAKNLSFYKYNGKMQDADVVFATGWETAYPVFNDKSSAYKMYFVQDFEPYFYPMGTNYILAENTYKFGFHGITAGGWLSSKLSSEYGMKCDHYDFGADKSNYKVLNEKKRKEIFFYARPVTERRGFDLGIMALEIFHKKMPDYTISLAGWDVSEWDVPFPHVNHTALQISQLPELYNKSAAALVMSLTNMSLLPLELLACGTIPIVNDAPNNRLVSDNPFIKYTECSPQALADALIETVKRNDLPAYAKKAADSVAADGWGTAGERFLGVLDRELNRG